MNAADPIRRVSVVSTGQVQIRPDHRDAVRTLRAAGADTRLLVSAAECLPAATVQPPTSRTGAAAEETRPHHGTPGTRASVPVMLFRASLKTRAPQVLRCS